MQWFPFDRSSPGELTNHNRAERSDTRTCPEVSSFLSAVVHSWKRRLSSSSCLSSSQPSQALPFIHSLSNWAMWSFLIICSSFFKHLLWKEGQRQSANMAFMIFLTSDSLRRSGLFWSLCAQIFPSLWMWTSRSPPSEIAGPPGCLEMLSLARKGLCFMYQCILISCNSRWQVS